jgi:glycosyltransferase involved in cell wall biosynthesis
VLAQTYPSIETIVVDDGSTDDTREVLACIPEVIVLPLEQSVGGAAARNRGIAASGGDLIAFLDSDDEWLPDKIAKQVPLLLDSPDVGAAYTRHFTHDDTTDIRSALPAELYTGDITDMLLAGRCPRTVSLFLVRREALAEVGGFDEGLRGFQDTDLWIRMALAGWHFAAVDEPLAVVHEHPADRITTDIADRQVALDGFLGKWESHMASRIGSAGIDRYRRQQLAVAQGSVVLSLVTKGRRLQAWRQLGTYVRVIRVTKPRQLVGLVVACVGGPSFHRTLKKLVQRLGRSATVE